MGDYYCPWSFCPCFYVHRYNIDARDWNSIRAFTCLNQLQPTPPVLFTNSTISTCIAIFRKSKDAVVVASPSSWRCPAVIYSFNQNVGGRNIVVFFLMVPLFPSGPTLPISSLFYLSWYSHLDVLDDFKSRTPIHLVFSHLHHIRNESRNHLPIVCNVVLLWVFTILLTKSLIPFDVVQIFEIWFDQCFSWGRKLRL